MKRTKETKYMATNLPREYYRVIKYLSVNSGETMDHILSSTIMNQIKEKHGNILELFMEENNVE
jgi:predicted DNA-binding protein